MSAVLLLSGLSWCSCSSDSNGGGEVPKGEDPVCSITAPVNGAEVPLLQSLEIKGTASVEGGTIEKVTLTVGDETISEVSAVPFEYVYPTEKLAEGTLTIRMDVVDNNNKTASHSISVTVSRELKGSVEKFTEWVAAGRQGNIADQDFAKAAIDKNEEAQAAGIIYPVVQQSVEQEFGSGWDARVLKIGDKQMKIWYKVYGECPVDGRSLYISLHGGGNTAPSVNDGQWNNQKGLYTPAEGVYLAPRAAVDDWDMWFQQHTQDFYDAIIRMAVIRENVNPDKVYLMGYSAGGDGLYRMAPRMADRWAACAMMAGHPGGVSGMSARNIGFTLWMGANDSAYNRNIRIVEFGEHLASLKAEDPEGYVYEVNVVPGKGHWMDLEDKAAVPWMAKFRRNPLPDRVAWKQDNERGECVLGDFYWLAIDAGEMSKENPNKAKELIVERSGNTFTVLRSEYDKFYIALNSDMVDFSQPVKVIKDGATLFEGMVTPNIKDVYESAMSRKDDRYIFSAYVTVDGQNSGQRN